MSSRRDSLRVEAVRGTLTQTETEIRVSTVSPGTDTAIQLWSPHQQAAILLLSPAQSLACWKGRLAGRERLFLSEAGLTLDGDTVRLSSDDPEKLSVSIFPAPTGFGPGTVEGLFQRFETPRRQVQSVPVTWEQIKSAGPARIISNGGEGVAEAPTEADFSEAAVWRLTLPPDTDPARDLLLRLRYRGDVARLTLNGALLTDSFYNGDVFEIGLKQFAPEVFSGDLLLSVLPLRRDAPLYLPLSAWPEFGTADSLASLDSCEIIETLSADFRCVLENEA